jgi:hypothetical protein
MDYPLFNQVIPVDLEISSLDPEMTYFMSVGTIDWWDQDIHEGVVVTPFAPERGNIGMVTAEWDPGILYAAGVLPEEAEGGPLDVVWTESLDDPTWTSIGGGLPEEWSPSPNNEWHRFQFQAAPQSPQLFLSAWGMGLWIRDMSDVVAVEGEVAARGRSILSRPSPNPAGDLVTCDISLREAEHVQLRIFGVEGQVVRDVDHGVFPPGIHTLVISFQERGSGRLPSGVYYLRLDAGGLSKTHKILITR